MIPIGRGIADEDPFVETRIGRGDQVLITIQVDIPPSAVVASLVGGSQTFEGCHVSKLPITVIAIQLSGLVTAICGQMVVKEQVQIAVIVIVHGSTAVKIAGHVTQQRMPRHGIHIGEHVGTVVAIDLALLAIGTNHEQVEIAVVVEIVELGSVTVLEILSPIGVGDVDEPERPGLDELILEKVIANIVIRTASGDVDVHVAVPVRIANRHPVRLGTHGLLKAHQGPYRTERSRGTLQVDFVWLGPFHPNYQIQVAIGIDVTPGYILMKSRIIQPGGHAGIDKSSGPVIAQQISGIGAQVGLPHEHVDATIPVVVSPGGVQEVPNPAGSVNEMLVKFSVPVPITLLRNSC